MKRAVYPGTFDPVTNGHLEIIERAARIFDELIVAVTDSSGKSPFFTLDERYRFLVECTEKMGRVKVMKFSGLLVSFCQSVGASVIVRGLREPNDFLREYQMALMNRLQSDGEIETVFLAASTSYHFVSSSLIREVAQLGGRIDKLVPEVVSKAFQERLRG